MTLTLKTLAYMGNLLDDRDFEPNSEDLAELIEYARERAAREACGKLLAPGESVELNYDPEEEDAECVAVRLDEGGSRDNVDHVAHAGADAYLALMVALERQAGEEA